MRPRARPANEANPLDSASERNATIGHKGRVQAESDFFNGLLSKESLVVRPNHDDLWNQVEISTFRTGGAGGQHRDKVESGVRLTHIPSGISAIGTEHRLQGRNRRLAFERLREKLRRASRKKKRRIPTRPSRNSVVRRLERKRRTARKKSFRRRPPSSGE